MDGFRATNLPLAAAYMYAQLASGSSLPEGEERPTRVSQVSHGSLAPVPFALLERMVDPRSARTPMEEPAKVSGATTKPLPNRKVRRASAKDATAPGEYTRAELEGIVGEVAEDFGIEPEVLQAMAENESSWKVSAVGRAGEYGLMQLMPRTAAAMGLDLNDPFNPRRNARAGARYLARLLRRYDGELSRAIAAYNRGPGRVPRRGPFPQEYLRETMRTMRARAARRRRKAAHGQG